MGFRFEFGLVVLLNLLSRYNSHLVPAPVSAPASTFPPYFPGNSSHHTNSPCFSGMYNPCGHGTCINLGSEIYRCVCPKGTSESTKLDGKPFCAPSPGSGLTYTVGVGDTCYVIAITFRLTIASLLSQNPGLNCDALYVGTVLSVRSERETVNKTCWIRYTVTPVDTCSSIRARFNSNPYYLTTINPALDCSNLRAKIEYLSICIREGRERSKFYICSAYRTPTSATSPRCRLARNARRTQLYNPGLYCGRLFRSPRRYCYKATPYSYLHCSESYTITLHDSCTTLYSKFALPGTPLSSIVALFKSRNKQLACDDRFLFVGQRICLQ